MKLTKEIVLYKEGGLTEAANKAIANYDQNTLNQAAVFNKLTNNGTIQGIYMQNGNLYINASFIKSGTLVLGGANNGNGVLQIRNANNQVIGTFDRTGITTASLTASEYISIVGNTSSYIHSPFGNNPNQFFELSSTGFKVQDPNTTVWFVDTSTGFGVRIQPASGYSQNSYVTNMTSYGFSYSNAGATYKPNFLIDSQQASMTYNVNGNMRGIRIDPQSTSDGKTFIFGDCSVGGQLAVSGSCSITGLLTVANGLSVNGTKNRLVKTHDYADRLLYCYETPTPMFGDLGEGEIGEDGLCYITFDPIFAQTVILSNYLVFTQSFGNDPVYVIKRMPSYFIVKGTPGDTFGWEVKARQSDFDQRRLDKRTEQLETENDKDYGYEAINHIEHIREERAA